MVYIISIMKIPNLIIYLAEIESPWAINKKLP